MAEIKGLDVRNARPASPGMLAEQKHWCDPLDHVMEHLPERHPELIQSSDWTPWGLSGTHPVRKDR